MSAPLQCPPVQVETARHTRFLGTAPIPAGQRDTIGGLATDDRFLYATYQRHDIAAPHTPAGPGELVVLDQALLADPGADPVVTRIPVGYRPTRVVANPDTGKIYVLIRGEIGEHPYSVFVVRRAADDTFAVTARIPIGPGLMDLAVNPRANRVYVANWTQAVPGPGTPVNGKVHVIDGNADVQLTDRAGSVVHPMGLDFDPATETLYATLAHKVDPAVDAVAAISCGADGATLIVQKVIPLPARSEPFDAKVLRTGGLHRLYVANMGSTPAGSVPPNLTRFELDGTFRSSTVPTAFGGPVGLAADVQAQQLYVTTNAGLQILDAVRETISTPDPISPFPLAVAVDPAGRVHVGDGVDGTLSTVLPVVTTGPVGEHWIETGGAGGLGQPVTGYRQLPGGDPRAGYQVFEQGAIFASTDYGAVVLSRELTAAWEALADRTLPTGTMQDLLGLPVEPAGAGSTVATFQRGLLFRPRPGARAAVGGFTVVDYIYDCYVRPGNSAGLGLPIEDQQPRPDGGLRQRFEHGEICWRTDIGAFAVYSGIHDWWGPNGPDNRLGYPLSDIVPFDMEYDTPEGHVVRHWHKCKFQKANIYWPVGGEQAYTSGGQLHEAYEGQFGGPKGKLGIPVGDETATPNSGGAYQNFENGVLVWHPKGHQYEGARMFASAEIRIVSFMLVDENDGPLGGDLDLWVRAVLARRTHTGGGVHEFFNKRFPSDDGDYDAGDFTFPEPFTMELAPVLTGEHEFRVLFSGYDADDTSADERMGAVNYGMVGGQWDDWPYDENVRPAYTVDNLWGLDDPDAEHTQRKFKVTYTISEKGQPLDDALPFRQQGFWQLHNFDTPRLDMDQYARTFADVDSSEPWLSFDPAQYADAGFEALFFHWPYKTVAADGNCFGMALEAVYALKGQSLFTQPVYRLGHPQQDGDHEGEPDPVADRGMINEFNVKHGYQVGAPTVAWFLQLFSLGQTHSPQGTFKAARRMFEDGDRPVLSFTRFIKFKGHTVLPIKFLGGDDHPEELPPGSEHWGEIWIADSKREWNWGPGPDHDGKYRVIIKHDDSFEYDGRFAGNGWIDARMFPEPWHLLNRVPTLPGADLFLEGFKEGARGVLALIAGDNEDGGGDVAVRQVTDGAGRTLFEPGLGRAPELWSDVRRDPAGRVPDLAPIPLSGGDADEVGPRPWLFFGRGQDATHTYEVTGGGGRYRFGLRAPAFGAVVTSRSGAVADHVTAARLGTADRSVAFAVPPGGVAKEVSLVLDGLPRSARGKQFLVDGLTVGPKQRVAARLRDGGRELLLENSGGATSCRVRVRPGPGMAPTTARQVPLAAGKVTRIRPADWRPDQVGSAPLRVEVRDAVDGPPVSCFEV
jgi:DNA-binding beta-propeller fold protein YncE